MNMNNHTNTGSRRVTRRRREYIYLLTIRKHQVKDFVTVTELKSALADLVSHVPMYVTNIVFEVEHTYMQLHLHCIIQMDHYFNYTRYTKYHGFALHFTKCYNLGGLKGYLLKQVSNKYVQEQLICENYYSHYYGFIQQAGRSLTPEQDIL